VTRGCCHRLWPPVQTTMLSSCDHPPFRTGSSIKSLHSPMLVCSSLTLNIYTPQPLVQDHLIYKTPVNVIHEQLDTCFPYLRGVSSHKQLFLSSCPRRERIHSEYHAKWLAPSSQKPKGNPVSCLEISGRSRSARQLLCSR
jgi:hypothetical protein